MRRVLAWCVATTASLAGAVAAIAACGGDAFMVGSGMDSGGGGPSPGPDARADASGDAGAEGDAGAPFCASNATHLFCEDFDVDGVPGKFAAVPSNATTATTGPRISADMITFLSPPESAQVLTTALNKPGDQTAALLTATAVSTAGSRLRLQAAFSIGPGCVAPSSDGSTTGADGVTLLAVGTGNYALAVQAQPSAAQLVEIVGTGDGGIANGAAHEFSALSLEPKWVTLTVDLNLATHTVTVLVGNAAALQSLPLTYPPSFTTASTASFELGAQVKDVNGISPGCRVHVDNVLFDIL